MPDPDFVAHALRLLPRPCPKHSPENACPCCELRDDVEGALRAQYVAGLDKGQGALIHSAAEVCLAAQTERLRHGPRTRQQLDDKWRSDILDVGVRIRARADAIHAEAARVAGGK